MTGGGLPFFLKGVVVKGFGRGSKDLGCPTANFSLEVVQSLPAWLEPGVYCGWAQVDAGEVHKMVANIGWCPFYSNKEKSIETHIIHKYDKDFYGSNLKVAVVKYLREEKNFSGVEELVSAIRQDIADATRELDSPDALKVKRSDVFTS